MATRILFVDDELGIRLTLGPILEKHGFAVATAATVSEALEKINRDKFDVLLSDLNIGQPGDGFTVVSAMRRVQPDACTFILTGYPDFETALQAIRNQVDDYLLKPTDVPTLLGAIQHKLTTRRPHLLEPAVKRVSELLIENVQQITREWLHAVKDDSDLDGIVVSESERIDHIPPLLAELARRVDSRIEQKSKSLHAIGYEHGKQRARHGYSIPQLVVELRLLQRVISTVLQRNLIRMDLSTVISDMIEVGEALQEQLEYSIRGFQKLSVEAA